jgi:hypothetical protein
MPPKTGFIGRSLAKGGLIPFLGAGASAFSLDSASHLPLSADLARKLAEIGEFPNEQDAARNDLARVASYVSAKIGRDWVVDFLSEELQKGYQPNPLHNVLAEVSGRSPMLIITTNYDDMMERALLDAGVPFDIVIAAVERKAFAGALLHKAWGESVFDEAVDPMALALPVDPISPTELTRTVVFKMHGSVMPPAKGSFVVTEEDYVAYLRGGIDGGRLIPPAMHLLMRPRRFLFLGYGLRDWNLRVLLASLFGAPGQARDQGTDRSSFAISHTMEGDEREIWQHRRVSVQLRDFAAFVPDLRADLLDIWNLAEP